LAGPRPICSSSGLPRNSGTRPSIRTAILRYLDSRAIALGDRVEVLSHEPFGGPFMVRVGEPKDGRVHAFGHGLAEVLSIELDR
jgi:hypothetical protein